MSCLALGLGCLCSSFKLSLLRVLWFTFLVSLGLLIVILLLGVLLVGFCRLFVGWDVVAADWYCILLLACFVVYLYWFLCLFVCCVLCCLVGFVWVVCLRVVLLCAWLVVSACGIDTVVWLLCGLIMLLPGIIGIVCYGA